MIKMFKRIKLAKYIKKAEALREQYDKADNMLEKITIGFEMSNLKDKVANSCLYGNFTLMDAKKIYTILKTS